MGSILMEPEDIISYARLYHQTENESSICLSLGKIESKGVFFDQYPLDYSVSLLLAQLSLASLLILSTSRLLQPLGLPSMVIQILGGLALGPTLFGQLAGITAILYPIESLVVLDAFSAFGYIFYFFLIGLQIDFWLLKKIERKDVIIGISSTLFGMLLSMAASFILLGYNHLDPEQADALPAVAVMSSAIGFPVVAQYLSELKMINSEFGRVALSSFMVSNLFGLFTITLSLLKSQPYNARVEVTQILAGGIGIAALIGFVIRPLFVKVLRASTENEILKQGFICLLLAGLLMTSFWSKALGLNIIFGPFLYGVIIPAGPPLGAALVEKLDLVTNWLFMPLYFVKNGLITNLFDVEWNNYLLIQFVILVACVGKFLGASLAALYCNVPLRNAISIGLVANVQGVFELGMFKMMKKNKAIGQDEYLVLYTSLLIVTSFVTMILRSLYDPKCQFTVYRRRTVLHLKPDSAFRVLACIHDEESVPNTINLLEALNPSKDSPMDLFVLHLVELAGRSHPILISHSLAKTKHSTSRSIVNAFKMFQQVYWGVVDLHPFTSISPYSTMHDEVCGMAVDKRAVLILVPFHKRFGANTRVESSTAAIRIMNNKILETSPCTVGIVVDRGMVKTSRAALKTRNSHHVAVFFIGGPDDREALAIGARMVNQSNVYLTIVRLLENGRIGDEDVRERVLDNEVLSRIRSQTTGDNKTTYVEEPVRDGTGTVAVMRSMENHHDLIIVGRRHNTRSTTLRGLSDWSEDSELGTIGDMFALADSSSNSTIMVVQQHFNVPAESHQRQVRKRNILT